MNLSLILFLFVLLAWTGGKAMAFDIPPPPNHLIYDSANLLSPASEESLEQALLDFETKTSNQIAIATFPSLEGEALEDLTMRIFERWKPGQKERDNGAILFIFKEDRAIRIEVGYGLEATLTDALSKRIIENELVPHFRNGDFEGGIFRGAIAMMQATEGAYTGLSKPTTGDRRGSLGSFASLLIVIFLLVFLRMPWWMWFGLNLGGHSRSGFGGGFGGGGFGGFGGGFGGGGGASGRW